MCIAHLLGLTADRIKTLRDKDLEGEITSQMDNRYNHAFNLVFKVLIFETYF